MLNPFRKRFKNWSSLEVSHQDRVRRKYRAKGKDVNSGGYVVNFLIHNESASLKKYKASKRYSVVHKAWRTEYPHHSKCRSYRLSDKAKISRVWKNVTCKRCLEMRKK